MSGRRGIEEAIRASLWDSDDAEAPLAETDAELEPGSYRIVEVRTGRRGKGKVWPHLIRADGDELDDADLIVEIARSLGSGRNAAQQAYGNGSNRVGTGPMRLNWKALVERCLSCDSGSAARSEAVWALGALAQVQSHTDAMRDAGAVEAVSQLLLDEDDALAMAAAKAMSHLACANDGIRAAAREAGAIQRLVRMLDRVAALATSANAAAAGTRASSDDVANAGGPLPPSPPPPPPSQQPQQPQQQPRQQPPAHEPSPPPPPSEAAKLVTAATAALRNLSFQNGPNRALIRDAGGLAPLVRIVAPVAGTAASDPPRPPPDGSRWREAAYRAAGALENLAADNADDASAIVSAHVPSTRCAAPPLIRSPPRARLPLIHR